MALAERATEVLDGLPRDWTHARLELRVEEPEDLGRAGLILHGGTPVARRAELVLEFQRDDGPPIFVLSVKAGGTGLNLTAASHVVHLM